MVIGYVFYCYSKIGIKEERTVAYLVGNHVEVIQFFVAAYINTNELVDKTDNQIIPSVYPYS